MTKQKPSDTVSVAWECAHCGKRYSETRRHGYVVPRAVTGMRYLWRCNDGCGTFTRADLRKIGRDAYAACWVR